MKHQQRPWMVRVLMLVLMLGAIPLAAGGPRALQASGFSGSASGSAYAWGYNNAGQLGNGTTTNNPTPAAVSLPSGVRAMALTAGGSHSLAIGSDGKLYAWARTTTAN